VTATRTAPAPLADAPPTAPAGLTGQAVVGLVPVGLLVVLVSHYPHSVAQRSSLGQYFTGVYRSRVLARELILGIANGIDRVVGAHAGGLSPGFAAGWVTVTAGGFLLAWWLLRQQVRSRAPSIGPIEVVLAAAMAASATVLTPYDFLSYALIIATVVAAGSGRIVATAVLAAAAVATRESGLMAVAIIAASCVVTQDSDRSCVARGRTAAWGSTWRGAARYRPLWAAAAAGVITYAVLKTVLRDGGGLMLFQHVALRANLTAGTAGAIALAAGLVAAGRWAAGPAPAVVRIRRRVLWPLALPYLVVLAFGSSWGEAPRLVMPLVLGEALLAIGAVPTARSRVESETPALPAAMSPSRGGASVTGSDQLRPGGTRSEACDTRTEMNRKFIDSVHVCLDEGEATVARASDLDVSHQGNEATAEIERLEAEGAGLTYGLSRGAAYGVVRCPR
jgi:hypothetical protein